MKKIRIEKKLPISLEVSERDKKLLLILLALAMLSCAYFFGWQKLTDKTQQYQKESTALRAKQKDLVQKNKDKEKYIADTEKYKKEYQTTLSNYSSQTSQDISLDFVDKMEKTSGTWIKSTTLSDPVLIYTFGNVNSSNPSNQGEKVYQTDMKGYKTTLTLSYEGRYEEWKDFIRYITHYYSKNTIDNISMSYNDITGTVSGAMTLSTYAVTGSQRKYTPPEFHFPTGTNNIFASGIFSPVSSAYDQNGAYILSNYDYFILLNASTSDMDSTIIGKKEDDSRESIISENSNDTEEVTVRVSGSAGNYRIRYQIGDRKYPAEDFEKGAAFDPGDTMDLLIMSSSRLSDQDKNTINLHVQNESDKPLNVKISNDDRENPRVKFQEKTGNVFVYQ